ncbi:MAG: portal protein, partial [Pseudomonadota bacterium]
PEEIPQELEGQNLKIEYIGPLAQAQKSVGLQAVERVVNFTSSLAQVKPDVLDKVDLDQAVDEYALRVGVPSRVVRSDEDVARIRRERQEQQQATQLLQDAQPLTQAYRNLQEAAQDRADR